IAMTSTFRMAFVIALVAGALISRSEAAGSSASLALLNQRYEKRHAQFAAAMEKLAAETEKAAAPEVAAAIRRLIPPLAEQTLDVDTLPQHVRKDLPASLPDAERQWRSQLRHIRSDYAKDLYTLSRRAVKAEHVSLAFHLVREVAFHDPDHRQARQLLGYVRLNDDWVTPFEQGMLRRGFVWHDTFGWLPQKYVERYEQGQRFYRGRWMSAAQEAAQRHDFNKAWEIESDHFRIKTNQSLERGVELSVALEHFHRFFRREFAAVFDSPEQMRQLFSTKNARGRSRARHKVYYYQSREEFVFRLREKQPGIEASNGLYLPADRTAYFFYSPNNFDANLETLFHEVTHQLLSESQLKLIEVGQHANFWLIEGIACYLESFEIAADGTVSVGDPRHVRLHWARERRLKENFFIPLSRFTRMGIAGFRPSVGNALLLKRYSQATGLTHFFLHYEDGIYRDALIKHLSQIYSPQARIRKNPQSLDKLTGVSFPELDRQYLSYLTEMQAALDTQAAAQQ
ncbi:MAG: hypothetical protein ACC645_28495, partial [Pirellulales bacterium]